MYHYVSIYELVLSLVLSENASLVQEVAPPLDLILLVVKLPLLMVSSYGCCDWLVLRVNYLVNSPGSYLVN